MKITDQSEINGAEELRKRFIQQFRMAKARYLRDFRDTPAKRLWKLDNLIQDTLGDILDDMDNELDEAMSEMEKNEAIDVIQPLLDCEADCIKSGNSLSPKEQKVALDVIANIQQRMKVIRRLNETIHYTGRNERG